MSDLQWPNTINVISTGNRSIGGFMMSSGFDDRMEEPRGTALKAACVWGIVGIVDCREKSEYFEGYPSD